MILQPPPSHCYFTPAMLQQWPFPLLPLPSPWQTMASSLADLKASSHSPPTQQNIDLIPRKSSRPEIWTPVPQNTHNCKIDRNTSEKVTCNGIQSSQSCGLAKKVFWKVDFDNLPETEVWFRRVVAIWGSTRMSGAAGCPLLFTFLSHCIVCMACVLCIVSILCA